jgi:hypothetical protein
MPDAIASQDNPCLSDKHRLRFTENRVELSFAKSLNFTSLDKVFVNYGLLSYDFSALLAYIDKNTNNKVRGIS